MNCSTQKPIVKHKYTNNKILVTCTDSCYFHKTENVNRNDVNDTSIVFSFYLISYLTAGIWCVLVGIFNCNGMARFVTISFFFSWSKLESRELRFVDRENDNKSSIDVEPEYITYNKNETKAYVCLQVRIIIIFIGGIL
jgi:hypothetical protein